MADITQKRCPRCKITKDKSLFPKDKYQKDGIATYCKHCKKTNQKSYRRKVLEKNPLETAPIELLQSNALALESIIRPFLEATPPVTRIYATRVKDGLSEVENGLILKHVPNFPPTFKILTPSGWVEKDLRLQSIQSINNLVSGHLLEILPVEKPLEKPLNNKGKNNVA